MKMNTLGIRSTFLITFRIANDDSADTPAAIPLDTTLLNQQEMLESAKEYVGEIIQETSTCEKFFSEASILAINYALDENQVRRMSFEEHQTILRFIILTEHYGMYGGRGISWEIISEQVHSLIETPEKMSALLYNLCKRACPEELKKGQQAFKQRQENETDKV